MHTVNAVPVQLVELDEQMLAAVVGGGPIKDFLRDVVKRAAEELVDCLANNIDTIVEGVKDGYAAAT